MPIATSGIYEVRLQTERAGQPLFNVFHYLAAGGGNDHALSVAQTFIAENTVFVQSLLSDSVTLVDVQAKALFGLATEAVIAYGAGVTGTQTGETMPTHVAVSLKFERSTRETRSGWKRFGPMSEPNVAGDFFTGTYLTSMDNAATKFAADMDDAGQIYTPIIYRAANTAIDPLPRYQLLSGVSALNRVTSQNSRKRFG